MARTKRLRETIVQILYENGPLSTPAVLHQVNNKLRHGTNSPQLGNILAKDPRFKSVGKTKVANLLAGRYTVEVWDLTKESREAFSSDQN